MFLSAWGRAHSGGGGGCGGADPPLNPLPNIPRAAGEEEITFPPTYRYERGSRDTYVWHKQKPTGVRR